MGMYLSELDPLLMVVLFEESPFLLKKMDGRVSVFHYPKVMIVTRLSGYKKTTSYQSCEISFYVERDGIWKLRLGIPQYGKSVL